MHDVPSFLFITIPVSYTHLDYFKEDRSGIFMQRSSVPSTMGVTGMLPYANIGSVKNKGVDMSVAYSKVIGKDWVLRLNGSLTYAHNEITEIDEPVNVEPYSCLLYTSSGKTSLGFTGFESHDGTSTLSFGFPYREAPKTYIRKLTLAPEVTSFQYLKKGETVLLTWEFIEGQADVYKRQDRYISKGMKCDSGILLMALRIFSRS